MRTLLWRIFSKTCSSVLFRFTRCNDGRWIKIVRTNLAYLSVTKAEQFAQLSRSQLRIRELKRENCNGIISAAGGLDPTEAGYIHHPHYLRIEVAQSRAAPVNTGKRKRVPVDGAEQVEVSAGGAAAEDYEAEQDF